MLTGEEQRDKVGAGPPSALSRAAPRQHPLTVPQVEVVGCPSRPQAHGVDGVVHVPGHGGIVGQRQHHLGHRQGSRSRAVPPAGVPPRPPCPAGALPSHRPSCRGELRIASIFMELHAWGRAWYPQPLPRGHPGSPRSARWLAFARSTQGMERGLRGSREA